MKTKLYVLLSLFTLLTMTSCSDSDDDGGIIPQPVYREAYVSRIKVTDLDNTPGDVQTIKIYYDSDRRVTGIHWGTTVPGRSAWKFVYGNGRIDVETSNDVKDTKRYLNMGHEGRAEEMFYTAPEVSQHTTFKYDGDRMIETYSENSASAQTRCIYAEYQWTGANVSDITFRHTYQQKDSLTVKSSIMYDEFSANNANIDINRILDAVCGMYTDETEIPQVLGLCGVKSQKVIALHRQTLTYAISGGDAATRGYEVLSFSIQDGRLSSMEVKDITHAKHKKIDIIYKAEQ